MKKLLISYGLLLSMLIVGVDIFNYGYSLSGLDLVPSVLAYDDDDFKCTCKLPETSGGDFGNEEISEDECRVIPSSKKYDEKGRLIACRFVCGTEDDVMLNGDVSCVGGGDDDDDDEGDDDDDDDDDGPPCTKDRRTGYFDKEGCYQLSKSDPAAFRACKHDGWKYVSFLRGFRVGCSNYKKGNLCNLKDRRLICPVDMEGDLDQLKRDYQDAKRIKKAAWQNYLLIKKQSKTSYKADKKEAWEEYRSAKKDILDEYKEIGSTAKNEYLDAKKTARKAYKKLKDPAREKYLDVREAYEKAKAKYKKCREKKSSKKCKDEKDDYKKKREKRNEAREEYTEIRDSAKAKYVSLRDKAKEDYLNVRNKAKKNYDDSKKELRATYDKKKALLLSKSKAARQNARSEYEAKKKIYLDAKAAYDKARGK